MLKSFNIMNLIIISDNILFQYKAKFRFHFVSITAMQEKFLGLFSTELLDMLFNYVFQTRDHALLIDKLIS